WGEGRADDVLASLERLVQHSLVVTERGRMRMLETIREYAAARLEESGEGDLVRTRHAAYFDGFVEDVHSLFAGPRAPEALAALDGDWENIDAVAPRSVAAGQFTRPVRLASLTWRYVWLHDRVREATAWMPLAYEARSDLEPALRESSAGSGARRSTSSASTNARRPPWRRRSNC